MQTVVKKLSRRTKGSQKYRVIQLFNVNNDSMRVPRGITRATDEGKTWLKDTKVR